MKIIIVSPKTRTIVNFRGDLIRDMIAHGHEVVAIGSETGFEQEIAALGARLIILPMKKDSINIVHDISYLIKLMQIFKKERPDLVFGYTVKPVIYGSIAAWFCGVKKIFPMITGLGYLFISESTKTRVLRRLVLCLYKCAFWSANNVIFQNPDDMNTMINYGVIKWHKCSIVHGSGVNMSRFPRVPLPEQLTFFMLSRAMRNKGVTEFLAASRIVKQRYPQIRCVLLGAVENMADSLTYDDIACYVNDGSIDYYGESADVRPYYANCSVYVLPSYREGTPRTVLEAMATGRPIITTDAPGCRETVVDGQNGFLVPIKDTNAVAEKMIWFIEHPEAIESMGEASFNYCKKKFDVTLVNQALRTTMGL